jgi:hypothetical protein
MHNDTVCPTYDESVLPDEKGRCSLCGAKINEVLDYLEKERQRGLQIYEEMDQLMEEGLAKGDQELDWMYYEGYADAMAAAINKLKG